MSILVKLHPAQIAVMKTLTSGKREGLPAPGEERHPTEGVPIEEGDWVPPEPPAPKFNSTYPIGTPPGEPGPAQGVMGDKKNTIVDLSMSEKAFQDLYKAAKTLEEVLRKA